MASTTCIARMFGSVSAWFSPSAMVMPLSGAYQTAERNLPQPPGMPEDRAYRRRPGLPIRPWPHRQLVPHQTESDKKGVWFASSPLVPYRNLTVGGYDRVCSAVT